MDLIEIKLEPNWSLKVKTPNLAVNSQWHYERGGTGYDNVDGQRANNTPKYLTNSDFLAQIDWVSNPGQILFICKGHLKAHS